VDTTLITVAPSGTSDVVYPATKAAVDTPVSNGTEYPFTSEYKSNGPAIPPTGNTNVITVVIL
jgi:hypothetical protein